MPARSYLLLVTVVALIAAAALAAFNLFVDPYDLSDRPFRLKTAQRTEFIALLPDYGRAAQLRHVAASTAPTLLLGTSRTLYGLPRDLSGVDNVGRAAGALEDDLELSHVAARRRVPPRLYILEATPVPHSITLDPRVLAPGWPGTSDRLFSRTTTSLSLTLLWMHLDPRGRSSGRYTAPNSLARLAIADRGAEDAMVSLKAMLKGIIADCARNRSGLLVYEPPHRVAELADPAIRRAILTRLAAYRRVMADAPARQRCAMRLRDMSGIDPAGRIAEARDDAHWADWGHFDLTVGQLLLERLMHAQSETVAASR